MVDLNTDYKRIMLKISGEVLGGPDGTGLDPPTILKVSKELMDVSASGKQLAVVMGGGNHFRGAEGEELGMDRVAGDQLGMVATLMNALAIKACIDSAGGHAEVFTPFNSEPIALRYNPKAKDEWFNQDVIMLLAGGTGNPYFTTDTAAALRALELDCDVMFKASKVDGVYDSDPAVNADAKRFDSITYDEVIDKELGVMDLTAVTLARENALPLFVFDMRVEGNMLKAAEGDASHGTIVTA